MGIQWEDSKLTKKKKKKKGLYIMVTKLFGNIFTKMKNELFHNFFYRKDKYKKEIFFPKS